MEAGWKKFNAQSIWMQVNDVARGVGIGMVFKKGSHPDEHAVVANELHRLFGVRGQLARGLIFSELCAEHAAVARTTNITSNMCTSDGGMEMFFGPSGLFLFMKFILVGFAGGRGWFDVLLDLCFAQLGQGVRRYRGVPHSEQIACAWRGCVVEWGGASGGMRAAPVDVREVVGDWGFACVGSFVCFVEFSGATLDGSQALLTGIRRNLLKARSESEVRVHAAPLCFWHAMS